MQKVAGNCAQCWSVLATKAATLGAESFEPGDGCCPRLVLDFLSVVRRYHWTHRHVQANQHRLFPTHDPKIPFKETLIASDKLQVEFESDIGTDFIVSRSLMPLNTYCRHAVFDVTSVFDDLVADSTLAGSDL